MHRFLADYGLHWIGEPSASSPRGDPSSMQSLQTSASFAQMGSAKMNADLLPPHNRFSGTVEVPRGSESFSTAPTQIAPASRSINIGRESADRKPRTEPPDTQPPLTSHCSPTSASPGVLKSTGIPDMEAVKRAVQELNALADVGPGEVVRRRDGTHVFKVPTINLTFWADGMQVRCYPSHFWWPMCCSHEMPMFAACSSMICRSALIARQTVLHSCVTFSMASSPMS